MEWNEGKGETEKANRINLGLPNEPKMITYNTKCHQNTRTQKKKKTGSKGPRAMKSSSCHLK